MISVCMAYYNRPDYLARTLAMYVEQHGKNILQYAEFVIVDDGSSDEHRAAKVAEKFKKYLNIRVYYRENKDDINPAVAINASIGLAKNKLVVITCPEIMPATPYLEAITDVAHNDYLLVPCYSVSQDRQKIFESIKDSTSLKNITSTMFTNPMPIRNDGDDGWYSHPFFRPVLFYFTAAITKDFFFEIGGIDEAYRYGWGYEDTDFVERLKLHKPNIRWKDNELCIHQNHYVNSDASRPDPVKIAGWERNRQLFAEKNY